MRIAPLLLVFLFCQSAAGAMLNLDEHIDGQESPAGTAPWVSVNIADQAVDSVLVRIEGPGLVDDEFIEQLYLNLDPNLGLGGVTVSHQSGVVGTGQVQADGFDANGEGLYDLLFGFPETPALDQLGPGEFSEFVVSGQGLTTASFLFPDSGGDGTPRYAVALVGGIYSPGFKALVGTTVPEPTSALLLAGTLLGMTVSGRRTPFQ